jgi:hypothetical protein
MAIGDLVTADWECEYQLLAFGGDSDYALAQIEGLVDLPTVTSGDRGRLLRHGIHPGDDFLKSRTVTLTLEVQGDDSTDLAANIQALLAAFVPGGPEAPLVMQIPGVANGHKFRCWVRPRRRNAPINREWFYNIPIVTIQMEATDPRLYSDTESTQALELPSSGGGMEFNETPNITFGAVSTGGETTLTNAGTFKTAPVFKLAGPVTDPRLTNVTSGETFHWEGTVASGDFLLVNMDNRTVLLNGTASRYSGLTSVSAFWELAPGDSSIQYRAASFTASTATATWRSAWV